MPNPDTRNGFKPIPYVLSQHWYDYDTATGTELYEGDLCVRRSNGKVRWISAVAGSAAGVCLSASKTIDGRAKILVADSPFQEFVAQDDGAGTAASLTHQFMGVDPTNTAGNATLKQSTLEIDISTVALGAAKMLKLLGRYNPTSDVTAYGSFTRSRLIIAQHQQRAVQGI